MAAPIPPNESERQAELESFGILDTPPEQVFDDITFLASHIYKTPFAVMSLVDKDRQWFKSSIGLDVPETHRDLAFCAHAIWEPTEVMVVDDAAYDPRFSNNPLVVADPSIRFYAGAPLQTSSGNALGTLCIIDRVPRQLDTGEEQALAALARLVMNELEMRRALLSMSDQLDRAAMGKVA
ncbi:MAG: GAF domain-containing protein [Acidimicrobiia bacterium]|nr:GAF domain-containing protein [Acidimicrobiia bacterium]MBT8192399.1 GAF domain-containing protein [Acidimicrobiia bacterium]MBT8246928.1 GAF domain-containing protein [Acidimicrobiia bacterium]NNF87613.1 GAF domain-containing protein [Acidimicrobiia bacterium]NNJ46938.1 GAF domain-containing protein [Acidimicrobiia bacterium]